MPWVSAHKAVLERLEAFVMRERWFGLYKCDFKVIIGNSWGPTYSIRSGSQLAGGSQMLRAGGEVAQMREGTLSRSLHWDECLFGRKSERLRLDLCA
jgi:hypothetical protein